MAEHLINIIQSTTINNDTHFHKLYRIKPTYNHLCIFGCLCFPNIVIQNKLSPCSTLCVFLGYPTKHKGDRSINLKTQQIIISRHVIFDQTIFPFRSMTPNQSPSYSFLENFNLPSRFNQISSPSNQHLPEPTPLAQYSPEQSSVGQPTSAESTDTPLVVDQPICIDTPSV